MVTRSLVAIGIGLMVGWAWSRIGFLFLEAPLSEQKRRSDIFAPTAPKYRRTQRAKVRNLREWQQRYDAERKRA